MVITRNHAVPMYIQIAEHLKRKIKSKKIKPGEKLGTQTELEERYSVSTITIRQALQILAEEDLIISKQGKGTFVKPEKVEQELFELQSLSDIIEKSGFTHKINIIKFEKVDTPSDIENFGSSCLYIERLHKIDDKNIALAIILLPYAIGSKFTIKDFEDHAVYRLLENENKIKLGEAVQIIESVPATQDLAKKLQVKEGTPLLKAKRITYDKSEIPVEKIVFYYRYDEFSFKVRLPVADHNTLWPSVTDALKSTIFDKK